MEKMNEGTSLGSLILGRISRKKVTKQLSRTESMLKAARLLVQWMPYPVHPYHWSPCSDVFLLYRSSTPALNTAEEHKILPKPKPRLSAMLSASHKVLPSYLLCLVLLFLGSSQVCIYWPGAPQAVLSSICAQINDIFSSFVNGYTLTEFIFHSEIQYTWCFFLGEWHWIKSVCSCNRQLAFV